MSDINEKHADLFKFYSVETIDDLIEAMEKHIESLQSSRRPEGSQGKYYFTKVREG